MKNLITFVVLLLTVYAQAQVGIGTTSPNSTLDVRGSFSVNYRTFSSNTNAVITDNTLVFTGTSAATLTLPDATACNGRLYQVKNASSNTSALTIATTSSQTIDGLSSWSMSQANQSLFLISNGTNWYAISESTPGNGTGSSWKMGGNNTGSAQNLGTTGNHDLPFITNNTEAMRLTSSGSLGIGITTPSAVLHLKAGTATVNTAPLKFTTGTNLATPENGSVEYNGTNLFITNGGTRETILTSASTFDTSNISNFYLKVRNELSGGTGISYNNNTGVITNSGVTSVNGNTGSLTMDTGYISNFYTKVRSLSSNTAPITYNSATGAIGITQATTSTNGYLSSTDWNTFNNMLASVDTSDISNFYLKVRSELSAGTAISYNSSTGVITNSGVTSVNGNTGSLTMDTGYISNFYTKVRSLSSNTAPITYNSATGAIGITQATTSTNGYLSSTDWNTFNNMLASVDTSDISNFYLKVRSELSAGTAISYNSSTGVITNSGVTSVNGNTGSLTMDTGYISNFYTKVRSLSSNTAPITYNSATGAIGITQATTSTNGYLSSTDWNTFNNMLASVDTSDISNFYLKVRSELSAGTAISYNSSTGVITNSGVTSVNGNTGSLTMDTGYISNFYTKVRSLSSNTAPITYNSATGAIGITQATTSTNGYLSSTDWNTFNNKAGSFSSGNLTETGSGVLTITGGTGSVIGSGTTVQVKQANTSQSGFLSSTDWNTFNNMLASVDTSDISNFYLKVRNELSGGTGISYNNNTGVITNSGVTSVNGNTGSLTMDTGYISNFYTKVRSLSSNSAPITYNSATGAIGITQATTSTNGYLNSTDWNTFNNKQGSGNYMTDPGGNGIVARTALNTTTNRSITGTANKITLTNGNGVSGDPTINVGSDIVDKTIANTYTGGAKQTFVNSATTAGLNLTASADPSTLASGDLWNSTTTANSLKYRDAASTTRTLVDLSLSQTLTNKSISGATNTISAIPNSALTNSSITVATGTTGTDVGVSGSPVSLGGTVTLNIPTASGTNTGKLSSTDWTTFNNKVSSQWTTTGSDIYYNTGNVGIGSSTFNGTNPEVLLVDAGTTTSVNAIVGKGTINSYLQLNIQNLSSGTGASSDVVATADNGSETTNYIDMGINGSGNTSTVMGGANDAYLYNLGQNLLIGTGTAAKSLVFMTGGQTQSTNERMRIDGSGNVGIGTNSPKSVLDVSGSVGHAITTTSSNLTLDATHYTVIITGSTPTITLPAASSNTRRIYVIVNQTGGSRTISTYKDFSGSNVTTVATVSSITVQSNGTSWYRIQ